RSSDLGSDFHSFRRLLLVFPAPPENRRAVFGRYNRIPRVFQHKDPISDSNSQRSSRCSLPDDNTNYRDFEHEHFLQIASDGFALPPFFGFQTGICPRGIDQGNYGFVEFLRQFHQPQGFTITFRIGHAKIAVLTLFGISTLLLANDHNRFAPHLSQATDYGWIIPYLPIPVEFDKFLTHEFDIIECIRPVRMSRELYPLPRSKVAENFLPQFDNTLF